jgi:hypothetical protein
MLRGQVLATGQPVSVCGQWFYETIRDKAIETPLSLGVVGGPCGVHLFRRDGFRCRSQRGQDGAPTLPVRAMPSLARAYRTHIFRPVRPLPCAQIADGAGRTSRGPRQAHEGTHLHDGHTPGSRVVRVIRQKCRGQVHLGPGQRRRGLPGTVDDSGKHTTSVRVHDTCPTTERKGGHRCSGVGAHAGKREKVG